MNPPDWQIECDATVFEQLKRDASFQQILALARAVNSLQFVLDAFVTDRQDTSSKAKRSRINSFLFGSAILYEGLLLVERMNQQFGQNALFKQGLHTLLKDPTAQRLRKTHMGPARNRAIFHYDVGEFGRILKDAGAHECDFMEGRGASGRESYFPFADALAAEVWMRTGIADEEFYKNMGALVSATRELAKRFIERSHRLILRCLRDWGFSRRALPV
jgi:hypothetical protein